MMSQGESAGRQRPGEGGRGPEEGVPVLSFEGSPFRLHHLFPPAGDQPEAIRLLCEGLEDGLMYQTLLGVTGSGKTYTMANVIARMGRPALVLAPNKTLAAQLYAEFKEFLPENAVEYFVSYYDYYQPEAYVPSRDLFIEKDSAINEHIEQMRLSATKSLMERRDVLIVFPAENAELAVAIELFEDEVEHLTLFVPLTGQLKQKPVRFSVNPS